MYRKWGHIRLNQKSVYATQLLRLCFYVSSEEYHCLLMLIQCVFSAFSYPNHKRPNT